MLHIGLFFAYLEGTLLQKGLGHLNRLSRTGVTREGRESVGGRLGGLQGVAGSQGHASSAARDRLFNCARRSPGISPSDGVSASPVPSPHSHLPGLAIPFWSRFRSADGSWLSRSLSGSLAISVVLKVAVRRQGDSREITRPTFGDAHFW